MEVELRDYRIFRYMLVLGLAMVFLAILMVLLGSNAKAADIYVDDDNTVGPWDGSMANPYQNITSAIVNSNPLDTIYVWNGTYNENITVDKELTIIGNSSTNTSIDGFGINNHIINVLAEGVEITGFNITESGMWYGIRANVGGFNIHDNVFDTQNYAIYMDIKRLASGSTVIGDIIVDNNEVIGTDGFYLYAIYEKPLAGSDLIFGQTYIANNKLYNTNTGIKLYNYIMRDMSGGSIICGDISINNNFVNCGDDEGIYVSGWLANMTDVDITLGDIDILGNDISSNPSGIWLATWDPVDIFGTTVVTIGETHINNNNIASQYYNGIALWGNDLFYLYDSAYVTTGDFFIFSNNITTADPMGQEGICIHMNGVGQYMYNDSSVDYGNMYIDSNIVDSNDHGIYVELIGSGSNMHDSTIANIGDIILTNNNLTSTLNGVHFKMLNVGVSNEGLSSATFGNFIIDDNNLFSGGNGTYIDMKQVGYNMHDVASITMGYFTIDTNNITSVDQGINILVDSTVRNLYNDAIFSMGDFTVNNNTINSTNSKGIHFDMQNSAYNLTGNATVTFGNFLFNDNVVNSTDNGVYFSFSFNGYKIYGNSQVYFGHIQLNDNTISCNDSHAIFIYDFTDCGTMIEGNSYFEMGNLEIKGNNIESKGRGIYCPDIGFLGNYLTDTSTSVFGDFIIEGNTINVSTDGIYFDTFYWGETLRGSSSATFGDISISNNNIESGNRGIFFQLDSVGDDLYDNAIFEMGSIMVSNNTILSGKDPASIDSYGIIFYTQGVGFYMYNETQAIMGPILVNDNTVTVLFGTNADGINIYRIARYGYNMYDNATFTMNGNIEVCRNTINTMNRDSGIYCDVYENGYYLYGNSTASFGNILFNDNVINSTGEGIHIDSIQNIAHYVYGSSLVVFGNIEINRNDIIAGYNSVFAEYGIYFYFYENVYMMFNDSIAYFGHIQINDNNVTSETYHAIHISEFYYIGGDMHNDAYFEMGNFEIIGNWIEADDDGINIYEFAYIGYDMYDNSTAVFGDFIINLNTINCSEEGIYFQAYDWGSEMNDNSSFSMGDWIINNNIIMAGGDGIYFDVFNWGETMTGSASATFGDFSVSNNNIESQNQGLFCDFENAGHDMHDMSRFEMGSLRVSNNTIISGKDPAAFNTYGILFRSRYVGYEMHNETQAIVGPILVNENTVTVLFGTNSQAIYINWISDYGANMYDTATFSMNGNIEVCRNTINTTNGDDGIFCDVYNLGNYLYGDNTATYGNFLFNDNTIIEAYNDGMHILVNAIGYYTYGDSSVTIGNVELNNNDMLFSNRIYFAGIDFRFYDLGASMYGGSIFNMGLIQMNDNTINNSNGLGLNVDGSRLGYQMYNSSSAYFGGFGFLRNNITSLDEGIYFDWLDNFASNLYDDAMVHFGNFLINNNIIITTRPVGTSDGIDVDHFRYVGYQMNDRSYAEFGNFEISGNEIIVNSSAKGIGIWLLNWASNMYDNASFVMGDFNFIDNNINASGNGIYWEPEYFGAYMYGNSTAIIGNNLITGNVINVVDSYGLYAWWWYYFAYEMHNNSMCIVGDSIIVYNVINVTGGSGISGIYTGPYDSGENVYDSSTAIFGDYIVSYNTINTVDVHGIQFSIYRVGYNMDGFASVTIGNISVSNNIINSTNGNGIYISDTYQNGNELYDNTKVTMGYIEFIGNHIEAGSNGITCDNNFYGFGSYLYNNSKFEMSDFNLIDNIITADFNGIYFEPYYFGAYMNDTSTAIIGNNFITGNEINVVDGYGLYAWWWYWFAHEMRDYSTCTVGDSVIMYNVINVTGSGTYGIYTGPWETSQYVYGSSRAIFGDYIVSYNSVYANNSFGIEFDIYHTGYEMYDYSNVTFGQFQIIENNITAPNGVGLYVNVDRLAYNIYNNSYLSMGNIQINGNNITSLDDAIDLHLGTFGFEIYDFVNASFGGVEIDNNILISSVDYGIYFMMDAFFSSIYGNSSILMEDIIISNNVITSEDVGIEIILFGSAALYDNATAYIPGFLIQNNIVDSNVSAFEFLTENTPFWNDPNAVQVWGDVILDNNNFDAGIFGAVFDWENQNPEVPQPTFYINYTRIVNGSTNCTGLFVRNINDVYIEDLLIDNITTGILVNNSNIWFMLNSTISNTLSYDMNFTADSYIRAINCTFNKTNSNFEDDLSLLRVGWFLHVLVRTQTGSGVPDANLTVADIFATEIFNGTTNSLGRISFLIVWEYEENITGVIDNYNNHTVQVEKSGSIGFADENMNVSKLIIIVLVDPEPPNIFDDTTDSGGTTGDPFDFGINATDNMGVFSVHVNYRLGSSGAFTNLTMFGMGPYSTSIVIPMDYVGVLEYYFSVQDISDYWISTGVTSVPITDNDAPTINTDLSDNTARTGDAFDFFVDAVDNINITEAHVVWWFGTGSPTNDTMLGVGPYNFAITVPIDSLDMLHYFFTITDEAGNWIIGPQVDISIKDNRPPELISINSETTAIAGEYFEFNATVSDNIEVSEVVVIYWFGTGAESNATMTGTEDFTFEILLPSDSSETLHYYITARDSSGNVHVGSTKNVLVFIVDKSPPEIIDDSSDTAATTGEDFTFRVTASDDFAIGEVHVVYWFGTGDIQNITIEGETPFTKTITIPVDSLETLHYYFTINDTSDNWLVGPQHDIIVTDNDAPYEFVDDSQIFATTGEGFTFVANANDNIGVEEIEVFYWFGDGTQTSQIMTGTGPFTHSITIPSDSLESLHYFFVARDAHGNAYQSTQKDITITDNDPGSISNDASDISGKIGEEFKFQIDVSDNIGISEVKVAYWFGDNESQKQFLTLVGTDGTYSGSIILEDNGTLHYYFEVTDEEGNTFEGPENSVDIASLPKEKEEEEPSVFPWIVLVILVVIVILFFLLLTRKKREPEEIPVEGFAEEPEEDILGEEEMGEELEDEDFAEVEPSEGEETMEEEEELDKLAEEDFEKEPEQVSDEELKPEEELKEEIDEEKIEDEVLEDDLED